MVNHLKVKKVRRGWLVVNKKTGAHTHFKSEYGCYCIKLFIREGITPENPYLQESYRRLTISKREFKEKYQNKPMAQNMWR